jgi:hypothetical protein
VLQSEYRGSGISEANLRELGLQASDLLRAVIHGTQHSNADNLFAIAEGVNLDPRFLPLLRKTISARVQAFIKLVDEQLNDEAGRAADSGATLRVVIVGTRGFGRAEIAPSIARGATANARDSARSKRSSMTRAKPSGRRRLS